MPWGAAIAAVAAVGGAYMSSSASKDAANTQANAANRASDANMAMYQQTQGNLSPYMQQGQGANNQLSSDLRDGTLGGKFTNADLNAYMAPNYQFQLQQGGQALQNSQAAGDGAMSGPAMKGMINYNQNTAAGAYQNAYQNWMSNQNMNYGQLSGLSSLGENAAAGLGNTGSNYASSNAALMTGAANAQAAGMVGSANAYSNGLNNASGYYMLNNMYGNNNNNSPGSAASNQNDQSYSNFMGPRE